MGLIVWFILESVQHQLPETHGLGRCYRLYIHFIYLLISQSKVHIFLFLKPLHRFYKENYNAQVYAYSRERKVDQRYMYFIFIIVFFSLLFYRKLSNICQTENCNRLNTFTPIHDIDFLLSLFQSSNCPLIFMFS